DQAYLAGLPFVRLIHGKGSGVLRQVIRDALNHHPLISSYRPGREGEGGDGVTVAKVVVD
ncbi:MAG: Smr/MutS family protein, partial [Anaerolineae bacterium]